MQESMRLFKASKQAPFCKISTVCMTDDDFEDEETDEDEEYDDVEVDSETGELLDLSQVVCRVRGGGSNDGFNGALFHHPTKNRGNVFAECEGQCM